MKFTEKNKLKEHVYRVKGMHCASCEILIEKKLLKIEGVKAVQVSAGRGEAIVEYEGNGLSTENLNEIFKKENYVFSETSQEAKKENGKKNNGLLPVAIIAGLLIFGFLIIMRSGLAELINVSSKSSLPAFFLFGLLAGVSSCAALVGGIVLSMSKQWLELYSERDSFSQKLQPHLMFNFGRLASYALLGAVLGLIGERLQISMKFTAFLIIGISTLMFLLALQMLGVKSFRKFQLALPKSMTRYIAAESNFKGRYMPFVMGAFTFFLPCGFTITSQGLALISGSAVQGGLIMLFFALGTFSPLLFIGMTSVKFSQKPHWAYRFSRIAGIVVLFFAMFNFNSQLNVLGYSSLSDFVNIIRKSASGIQNTVGNSKIDESGLAPIVGGKQILKMDASSYGYSPNYFKIKAGVPVRWEITDKGTSGCTNAIISRGLFDGEIPLASGKTSVKEFTPAKTGKYKFSCWMGMVSGIIEVVDKSGGAAQNNVLSENRNSFIKSGAEQSGGTCGTGGGCNCGGI